MLWCEYGNPTKMGSWIPSGPDLLSICGPDHFEVHYCGTPLNPHIEDPVLHKNHWPWTEESFAKFQNAVFFMISKFPSNGLLEMV